MGSKNLARNITQTSVWPDDIEGQLGADSDERDDDDAELMIEKVAMSLLKTKLDDLNGILNRE